MAIDLMQFMTLPTQSVEGTVNEPVSNNPPGDSSMGFPRYGVMFNGNTVGFTKLNELMDADGIGAKDQKRYEVQQKWLANFDAKWGNKTDPIEQEKYKQVRDRIMELALTENEVIANKVVTYIKERIPNYEKVEQANPIHLTISFTLLLGLVFICCRSCKVLFEKRRAIYKYYLNKQKVRALSSLDELYNRKIEKAHKEYQSRINNIQINNEL